MVAAMPTYHLFLLMSSFIIDHNGALSICFDHCISMKPSGAQWTPMTLNHLPSQFVQSYMCNVTFFCCPVLEL